MTEETKDEVKTETVFSSYTDAQKRATEKYRLENREKINEQRKKYYQTRKETDPEFLKYKREKAREYYLKKKENKTIDTEEPKIVEVIVAVELPVLEDTLCDAMESMSLNPVFVDTKETETTIDIIPSSDKVEQKKKRSPGILQKNKIKKQVDTDVKEEIIKMEAILDEVKKEFNEMKEPTPIQTPVSSTASTPIHCIRKQKKKSPGKK